MGLFGAWNDVEWVMDMAGSPDTAGSLSSREWSREGRLKIDRLSEDLLDERPPRNTKGVELTGCSSAITCIGKSINQKKKKL